MKTVADILEAKGVDVISVSPDTSVYESLQLLAANGIGALVVTDDEGRLVGIVSERDYARKVVLEGKNSTETTVSQIMTSDVVTVERSSGIDACMAEMTDKHIRHLPVIEDGNLLGVISIGDVVKMVIRDLTTQVEQLDSYIRGG